MTQDETPSNPETRPELTIAPSEPPASTITDVAERRRRSIWPIVFMIGFVILAVGEGFLWHLYRAGSPQSGQIAALQAEIAGLQKAQMPNAAVSQENDSDSGAQSDEPAKLAAVTEQLDTLQTLITTDHAALINLQSNAVDVPKLSAQFTAIQAQEAADHSVLTGLQASTIDLTKLTSKMTTLSRLNGARMALDDGQAVGTIPGAPPALATFATTPPPTQAQLALSFPAAARRAESASVANNGRRSYWSSVLARFESIITISNGTHVLVGAPAAGVISQAQASLNAGDLSGAVSVLGTLSQTTQAAMGDWLVQARALLAARAAIISLAGQS